jgi:hypothetical protein
MGGGYYYNAYKLMENLANDIEYELKTDFKKDHFFFRDGEEVIQKVDYLNCRIKSHRKPIKEEIKKLIESLKDVSKRAKFLDDFMNNKITSDEYLELIKNNNE